METGIIVCGLNGTGKSTLGSALAGALGFGFIDAEDLFFSGADDSYANPRPRGEAVRTLADWISANGSFVFASVRGDFGPRIEAKYRFAVLTEVSREIRIERLRRRSLEKYGSRALPGGDLFEREARFLSMAASRPEDYALEWARTLTCPLLRVDGTASVPENIALIREKTGL